MNPIQILVAACLALVLLTFIVGMRMFYVRIKEMKRRKIPPQAVALSSQRTGKFQDSRSSDNYNHLFELPVLFYTLCVLSISTLHIPSWLPALACLFVLLRVAHSIIQCTYNNVMHRFYVFLIGFFLLTAMWLGFAVSYITT